MEKQFVTFEIALKLKELGFNKPCLASYYTDDERNYAKDGTYDCRQKISSSIDFDPFKEEFDNFYINSNETYYVSAPLWQQVIDWFREKHNLSIDSPKLDEWNPGKWSVKLESLDKKIILEEHVGQPYWRIYRCFDSYEKAREQAILKAIELCKDKKS